VAASALELLVSSRTLRRSICDSWNGLPQATRTAALAARAATWLRDEEARARGPGMGQTSYRLVIDAGHNQGTSLREDAGYDEKC